MNLGRAAVLTTIVAASLGQAGQPVSRVGTRRPPVVISEETGLIFRLAEGAEVNERLASPAPATALDAEATQRILDRLPPLAPMASEQQPFAFRERSLPPPLAGATVVQQFPPPAAPPSGPPPIAAGESLTVLRRSPEGRVPLASHLSVTFSQPMVPVGSHDDLAAKGVPVRLTPEPSGKWRWVGTRTLLFEPAGRFPMATTYRVDVPAGTTPASGPPSAQAVHWEFTTPAPTLIAKHPDGAPARRDAVMLAVFDQRIDRDAVLAHLRVTAAQGVRELRLATPDEVQADEGLRRMTAGAGEGRWLAFRTRDSLPPDTGVTVVVAAGTPSAEGPLITDAAQTWTFQTFGPLRVTRHRCGWQEGVCPPGAPWQIDLSNPVDAKAFSKDMVRVEPALPGLVVSTHGPRIVVQGRSKPRTTYRVTLSGALPDEFGQTLGAAHTLTFVVGRAEPSLTSSGSELVVLDPAAGSRLSVYSTGLAALKVTVHRVAPTDWPSYRAFQERAQRDRALPVLPGTGAIARTLTVAGSTDDLVETVIDLAPALPGGLGHAIVVVEPATPAPAGTRRRWPGRVIKWVQATRIGLDAFVDRSRLVAWATALDDGRPLSDIEVQLLPGGPRAETGPDGLATLALRAPAATALLARKGNDVALLPARTSWWDQTGWQPAVDQDQVRWMVFDDRGLYRPGEETRVKGWVRLIGRGPTGDVEAAPAAVQSVSYILRDSQGNEVAKGAAPVGVAGGFDLSLALPATMNLGAAMLELKATAPGLGGVTHAHAIQVQEFRRPEFEVAARASEGPHFVGGEAVATVRAAYFAGGVLPIAPVTWNVRSTPGQFTPPGRDDFSFGTWVPWWRPWNTPAASRTETFESRTDAGGEHHLKIAFERVAPPQASQVEAEATVMDVNRQAWTSTARLLVHPADVYVGLRAPRLFVQQGERLDVDAVVVDLDGRAIASRPVQATLERLAWEQVAGEWKQVAKDREVCPLTSGAEPTRCGFAPREGGSYRVTATVTDGKGRPNQTRIQVWVAGGAQPPRREVAQEEVTLVPSKKDYRPGETAEVLVLAPFADAEGLLTLRRSGLVRTERFRIQGSSYTLQVPIEDGYVPNVHLQVDLVGRAPRLTDEGAVDTKRPQRPAFATGTIDLAVPPVLRTLAVSVAARDAALEPGGKTDLTLEVKDAAGRPVEGAELAVVVVDEAVLALSAYKIPDPLDVFYAKRDPEVADHHLRAHVLLGRPAEFPAEETMLAMDAVAQRSRFSGLAGGAVAGMAPPSAPMARKSMAEAKQDAPAPIAVRADFRALALFVPAVRTDGSGRATVPVTVPESLTRYRITAVAVSGARHFGKGESTVTARLPLMVRPSAPRFLNFGDRFDLPVVVQNQTQAAMTVDVAVRASNAELTQGAGRRVTVPAGDRVEVLFPATTVTAGTARFQVGAASGRWVDAAEVVLPVWTPATTEAFATYGQIDAGSVRQPIQTPRDVVRQFGGLEVTTSSTALSALTDAVLYLTAYPFECAEQLASRVLAVAALKDVLAAFEAKGLPPPAELTAAVDRDITLLARLQNDDGGFPFWRRGDESWPYLGVHVAHALQRAKEKGFAVPEQTLSRARAYVVDIEGHIPRQYGVDVRRTIIAYALHVRSRMGDRDVTRARSLLREAGVEKLSFEALGWILPLLSADPGSQAEAAQVLRHLTNRVTETAAAAHFAVSYGEQAYLILHSDRRADAVVLEGLIAAQPKSDLIPKIVTGLLAHRRGGRWENTQENTFVLLALDRYFATYEKATPDFAARLWLGEAYAGEHAFRGRTTERHQVAVPMAQLGAAGSTSDLVLSKEGRGRLYYRVGLRYAPASLKLAAADHGFTVERVYEAVDDPGDVGRDADGSWRVRAGSRVRVNLTMVAPARRYHVALVDPLPAGLEALNPALATTGALPSAPENEADKPWPWWTRSWFEHQNLRDERVEAFTTLLWEGVHRYSYVARATTPGRFVVPPSKAEEMYHPETFGRGATDVVVVENASSARP